MDKNKSLTLEELNGFFYGNLRIGILGGSFHPPHIGHLHLSVEALKFLRLDYVLWLINHSHPNKQYSVSYDRRFKMCNELVSQNKKIVLLNYEHNSDYFIDLLYLIKNKITSQYVCLLCGADLADSFHNWKSWWNIINLVDIYFIDRPGYTYNLINSRIFNIFNTRRSENNFRKKIFFLRSAINFASSSSINKGTV